MDSVNNIYDQHVSFLQYSISITGWFGIVMLDLGENKLSIILDNKTAILVIQALCYRNVLCVMFNLALHSHSSQQSGLSALSNPACGHSGTLQHS